jgi:threonine aldolase
MRGFASDNTASVHPEVLAAIAEANTGHAAAYGDDPWTAHAEQLLRGHFGEQAAPYLVFNGSAANVLCFRALCREWQSVICADTAHVHLNEGGAPERIAGVKLHALPTPDGKLTPELIAPQLDRRSDIHTVHPRVVTVTQSTELGTLYSVDELSALTAFAHAHELLVHVDGTRLANAAAALDVSLGAITSEAGVDAVSFGGTKNGLLLGEAVIFTRAELGTDFVYLRKQTLQLASKSRFIAAQFIALLEGDLWRTNAAHANAMAVRLRDALIDIPGLRLTQAVQANGVFAVIPREAAAELARSWHFNLRRATGEARWMCSWDTTPEDVDGFAEAVAAACHAASAAGA